MPESIFSEQKKALVKYWESRSIVTNKRIIEAFLSLYREDFMIDDYKDASYDDNAFPIICNQTISQPTTVAIMLEALDIKEDSKVLEVGAGSGYNAALIGLLAKKGRVYSTEIIKELVNFAKQNINKQKINNVDIIHSDGSLGLMKHAPFDRIIVTAACPRIPADLVSQLKENGIIVAPVGTFSQRMIKGIRKKGKLITEDLGCFSFVPLKGKRGF